MLLVQEIFSVGVVDPCEELENDFRLILVHRGFRFKHLSESNKRLVRPKGHLSDVKAQNIARGRGQGRCGGAVTVMKLRGSLRTHSRHMLRIWG